MQDFQCSHFLPDTCKHGQVIKRSIALLLFYDLDLTVHNRKLKQTVIVKYIKCISLKILLWSHVSFKVHG